MEVPALNREKKWNFVPAAKAGDQVVAGDVLGTVQETTVVLHKIMVPPTIKKGTVQVDPRRRIHRRRKPIAMPDARTTAARSSWTMIQSWPVRIRPPVQPANSPPAVR